MKTAYTVLKIRKYSSIENIKKAYRELSMEYHPDRCKLPNANEIFSEISVYYNYVSTQTKKTNYDKYLKLGLEITYDEFLANPDLYNLTADKIDDIRSKSLIKLNLMYLKLNDVLQNYKMARSNYVKINDYHITEITKKIDIYKFDEFIKEKEGIRKALNEIKSDINSPKFIYTHQQITLELEEASKAFEVLMKDSLDSKESAEKLYKKFRDGRSSSGDDDLVEWLLSNWFWIFCGVIIVLGIIGGA